MADLTPTDEVFELARAHVHALHDLFAQQPTGADSEVVRRAVRAETAQLQAELADANAETERLHDVLARLIGERDALRERTHELVQCLEVDPACMRLVGQIPSLYEAYNRARFVSRISEATSPDTVPSTGEDEGADEDLCRCGGQRGEHGPDCCMGAHGDTLDYCPCKGFVPATTQGERAEQRVVSLMDALEDSVAAAKKARDEQLQQPVPSTGEDQAAPHGIPAYAMLDVWMALGGDPRAFDRMCNEDRRTPADTWSQLLGVIRGDEDWSGDTNPPPGPEFEPLIERRTSIGPDQPDLTDAQFRALMDLVMVSDPTPLVDAADRVLTRLLDAEATSRGFDSWTVAYHECNPSTGEDQGESDSARAREGMTVVHKFGGSAVLSHRKDDDSGWWLKDGSGVADWILDSDSWQLIDEPVPDEGSRDDG